MRDRDQHGHVVDGRRGGGRVGVVGSRREHQDWVGEEALVVYRNANGEPASETSTFILSTFTEAFHTFRLQSP